ncbi:hypothetical protein QUW58_20605 [Enterocloster aldenensis]|uniref:DUF6550 family protein n=1 Tax=Enterocloster aldenensis TaxID=358742 RepID=UPI0025A45BE2|nr:DUF6550 family protein [Enterocloster clostridioformis]MDM8297611.1 hypothetical protein [Enterocloster aldenensis]
MKLSEKTKKYLAISGGAVIGVGLIAAISLQFNKVPAGEDTLPEKNTGVAEIVVDPSSLAVPTEEPVTEETEVIVQPNTETAAGSTESSQPVDTRPAQTDQTEQSIQPEVTKPAEPSQEVKKDVTQKPDGTKVETPPVPVAHESVVPPAEPEPEPGQPQGGEIQDGKVYLPGFGWVTDTGSSGTTADDMYENGNKIGDMGN